MVIGYRRARINSSREHQSQESRVTVEVRRGSWPEALLENSILPRGMVKMDCQCDTDEFLAVYCKGAPPGCYLVMWHKPTGLVQWVKVAEAGRLGLAAYFRRVRVVDLYFSVGFQGELPTYPSRQRGGSDTVAALPGVWFDLDVNSGVHSQSRLPTEAQALGFLSSAVIGLPTIVVHSGGGLHLYWLFDTPLLIKRQEDRMRATNLSRSFQSVFCAAGKQNGWEFDLTADLARVLRLPGTYNSKGGRQARVRILSIDPDKRLALSHALSLAEKNHDPLPSHGSPSTALPICAPGLSVAVDAVTRICPWLRHCWDHRRSLSEPEWWSMLTILARCENGIMLAHEWSRDYRGYTYAETDAKLKHVISGPGPHTCSTIMANSRGAYCSGCQNTQRRGNPILHLCRMSLGVGSGVNESREALGHETGTSQWSAQAGDRVVC